MSALYPKIYVACLAAYNSGHLHGAWIDAHQDEDEIWGEIKTMLANSPVPDAEEHAIHDYEDFGGVDIGEYESIKDVAAIGAFIFEHDEIGAAVLSHCDNDLQRAEEMLENGYGEYDSLADYAQQLTEDCSDIPDHLAPYIDYESMARDMELNGDVVTIDGDRGSVYVFQNC